VPAPGGKNWGKGDYGDWGKGDYGDWGNNYGDWGKGGPDFGGCGGCGGCGCGDFGYGPETSAPGPVSSGPYGKGKAPPPMPVIRPPGKSFSRHSGNPNTVTLLGSGLPAGIEKEIEEQARQLCIQHSFSTPDEVRYISPSVVLIDFPYQDACREFLRVSNGQLKVRQWVYRLQHSSMVSEADAEAALVETMTAEENPSDTLMVRLIGELEENQIKKAFQAHVPLVKGVRMMLDRSTRKSKGFCFVSFYSVSDAMTAKNRMIAAGSQIQTRKVAVTFAKPQNQEQALESNLNAKAEQDVIQAQAKQALSGLNAEMWSSYMQFCEEEKEKENREKQALLDFLEAKKRALREAAAQQEAEAPAGTP